MKRRNFLQIAAAVPVTAMMNLHDLSAMAGGFESTERMPVFFIGHGNPMHAVWDNPFTRSLAAMGKGLVHVPKVILVVSAHWLTRGTYVSTVAQPETIYDFGGFPDELYRVQYPAPGAPAYAREVKRLVPEVKEDSSWGLDHGAWTVLKHMFPGADIPVFQMSIDYYQSMQHHYDVAARLRELRHKGVLVVGSGNIVHNLRMWAAKRDEAPYDWAVEFDDWIKQRVVERDFQSVVNYQKSGGAASLSVPTVDHYVPLLYSLGMTDKSEEISFPYEEVTSAISMRCIRIG